MRSFEQMRGNAIITAEQYRYLETEVKKAAEQAMNARKLFPVRNLGARMGTQQYSYDTGTDMSVAELAYTFAGIDSKDTVNLARTNINVPVIARMFRISYEDMESSRDTGHDLNAFSARSATYRVEQLLETMLIQGWSADGTNYDISGLYQSAGNTYGTSADFATAGKAITATAAAIGELLTDNIMPSYNMILNATQWTQLQASVFTGGVSEIDKVTGMLAGSSSSLANATGIYVNSNLTAGTGMVIARNPTPYFELLLLNDLTLDMFQEKPGDPRSAMIGRVWLRGIPVIYDTNAICTMTAI